MSIEGLLQLAARFSQFTGSFAGFTAVLLIFQLNQYVDQVKSGNKDQAKRYKFALALFLLTVFQSLMTAQLFAEVARVPTKQQYIELAAAIFLPAGLSFHLSLLTFSYAIIAAARALPGTVGIWKMGAAGFVATSLVSFMLLLSWLLRCARGIHPTEKISVLVRQLVEVGASAVIASVFIAGLMYLFFGLRTKQYQTRLYWTVAVALLVSFLTASLTCLNSLTGTWHLWYGVTSPVWQASFMLAAFIVALLYLFNMIDYLTTEGGLARTFVVPLPFGFRLERELGQPTAAASDTGNEVTQALPG